MLFVLVTPEVEISSELLDTPGLTQFVAPDFSAPIEVRLTGDLRERADAALGAISPLLVGAEDNGSVQVCLAGAAAGEVGEPAPASCFVRVALR